MGKGQERDVQATVQPGSKDKQAGQPDAPTEPADDADGTEVDVENSSSVDPDEDR